MHSLRKNIESQIRKNGTGSTGNFYKTPLDNCDGWNHGGKYP